MTGPNESDTAVRRDGSLRVMGRGLRRRCPRCGIGSIYAGWIRFRERCAHCGLELEPEPGSTWGLLLLGDRAFLFVLIVVLYFGLRLESHIARLGLLAAIVGPMIYTLPHRQGLALAFDYLVRRED